MDVPFSDAEQVKDIRNTLKSTGKLSELQRRRFLAFCDKIDNGQMEITNDRGHKKADDAKEEIEDLDELSDDDGDNGEPPAKRRKLNNDGNKRIKEAMKRSEDEA